MAERGPHATARQPGPERRTKILYVIGTLDVGGAEMQLVELTSRLDPAAFEAVVCSVRSGGVLAERLRARDVRVHALGFVPLRHANPLKVVRSVMAAAGATLRFFRLIRRERPDIVHGVLLTAYVLATLVGRIAGVPVIVSSRRSLGRFKASKRVHLLLEPLTNRMTDLFIANSKAVRDDTLAHENIDPGDIVVVHNGVDLSKFFVPLAPFAGAGASSAPVIAVVANLIPYKGHDYFLSAWVRVVARHPGAVAMLAGEGSFRAHLEGRARDLGIASSVRFLGLRDDVPALLASSDLFVHPSTEEGCSNAVLEAMAAARPIVATSVGGTVEVITHRDSGLLVPPCDAEALAEAILFMLSDPEAARAMGVKARAVVERRFEIGASVRAYEGIYRSLVAAEARELLVPAPVVRRSTSSSG